MKPKTVVLLGTAMIFGLIAAYWASTLSGDQKAPDMVKVVTAAKELRQGTPVTKKNFKDLFVVKMVDQSLVPPGAITDENKLDDVRLTRTLDRGVVVTEKAVSKLEGMEKDLPPGHVAMAIGVRMDTAVAGFIRQGSRVDLMGIFPTLGGKKKVCKIFMQRMLVLAVNQDDIPDDKKRTSGVPSTVTLAVTRPQSEQLRLAQSMTEITLVLRKVDDNTDAPTKGTDDPLAAGKTGDEGGKNVELFVAKGKIDAKTVVDTEAKFDELFQSRSFVKANAPPNAIRSKDQVLKAKTIYAGLFPGQILVTENLENAAQPEQTPPPAVATHWLTITNGRERSQFQYNGTVAVADPGAPVGSRPGVNVPGSEGK
jgi:Flp pilus assembly protein CpaB